MPWKRQFLISMLSILRSEKNQSHPLFGSKEKGDIREVTEIFSFQEFVLMISVWIEKVCMTVAFLKTKELPISKSKMRSAESFSKCGAWQEIRRFN